MEQFWNKFPDITCLYPESSFHVIGEQIEVDTSKITELCLPPTNLMKVDVSSRILLSILPDVCNNNNYCYYCCNSLVYCRSIPSTQLHIPLRAGQVGIQLWLLHWSFSLMTPVATGAASGINLTLGHCHLLASHRMRAESCPTSISFPAPTV